MKIDRFHVSFRRKGRTRTRLLSEIYKQLSSSSAPGGVSSEAISNERPYPTRTTARLRAHQNSRKRRTKPKDESSDAEVYVPRSIHSRGHWRRKNKNNTITNKRGPLDSGTFHRYFMHIWNAFPEEKVKSVAYFYPLWFCAYANEHSRVATLNWIKKKAVFSRKYVLVPIVMWSHWSLLIFCNLGNNLCSTANAPCMLLLDSLHSIGPERLEPLIRRLLVDMYKSEERAENIELLQDVPLLFPEVPQQKKGMECGFYVLHYVHLFLESAPENFNVSAGYPYFMGKKWFTGKQMASFYKRLDDFPVVSSDDESVCSDSSSGSIELIEIVPAKN